LVKAWNFENEFLAAKKIFGATSQSDSRCFEESADQR